MTHLDIISLGWEEDRVESAKIGMNAYFFHVGTETYRLTHSTLYTKMIHKESVSESTIVFEGKIAGVNGLMQLMRQYNLIPTPTKSKAFKKTRTS